MKEERIDLTDWEIPEGTRLTELDAAIQELTNELKRCYDEIDDLRARLMLAPYEEGDGYSVTCEACDKDWMIQDAKLLASVSIS